MDTVVDSKTIDTNINPIKPINIDTVHKICSGQVVLSLAVAVKELVENALDAGATNIDIRLKNYGLDLVEVSDNGSGVMEYNFAALTLKSHTSKLSDYADLLGITSFGFRGEALSSLCSLADLTITTRHKSSEYGVAMHLLPTPKRIPDLYEDAYRCPWAAVITYHQMVCPFATTSIKFQATKINFDHKGNITNKSPCSRQIGTTVTLCNLFSTLPVRQKEFQKNAKREFNRMTNLLYAYCLISLGVKITCTNQTTNNSKSLVVATTGSTLYKDNIACVFGMKQLQSILEIKTELVSNIKDNIFKGLPGTVNENEESVNIEDIEIDLSEDSNDTENEVKTQYSNNSSQKSQGYKNIANPVELVGFISSCAHGNGRSSTDRQYYYVNSRPCEPTKIMKLVNEIYRQYNPNQYPFVFINVNLDRTSVDVNVTPDKRTVFLTKEKMIIDVVKASLLKLFENIPRTLKVESSNMLSQMPDVKPDLDQPRIFNSFIKQFSKDNHSVSNKSLNDEKDTKQVDLKRKTTTLLDFVKSKTKRNNEHIYNNSDVQNEEIDDSNIASIEINVDDKDIKHDITDCELDAESEEIDLKQNTRNVAKNQEVSTPEKDDKELMYLESDNVPNTQIRSINDIVQEKSHTIYCKTKNTPSKAVISTAKVSKNNVVTDRDEIGKSKRKHVNLKTSLEHVKALADIYNKQKNKNAPQRVKFKGAINPVFNKKCEEELSREISRDSFKEMKVIGQFNLGFIITRLEDDLFIIDQHATDEIYNFETLQKTTELTHQKLVIPQQLELTGVNEQILMDNLDVFKKNGFTFEINEHAPPTKRVKLLTIPMSKNWIFGKEDIEELLFMLRESESEHCRPSRVRAMFASRACRKSVMIGTALGKADMKKLVDHMAEIDKPWNCPHGRPTIRHLVNLAMIETVD